MKNLERKQNPEGRDGARVSSLLASPAIYSHFFFHFHPGNADNGNADNTSTATLTVDSDLEFVRIERGLHPFQVFSASFRRPLAGVFNLKTEQEMFLEVDYEYGKN